MFIATLIASESINADDIAAAVRQIDQLSNVESWTWIDEARAVDIRFSQDVEWAHGVLAGYFERHDIVIQPATNREKKLLVADMDSTMITVECIDELADFAGIKGRIAAITEAAMRGELDFEGALDARVALLAGLDEAAIDRCRAERVKLMPGAKTLIQTMKKRGARTVLVSGGFTRFAEPVAAEIGFDRAIANVLDIAGGKLSGTVRRPIVGAQTKLDTLEKERAALGLAPEQTLAVGDGANDLPMIKAAGLGVAYHAKPIVAAAAAACIDFNDLTALLYAQGIPRSEWVTA